jgi:urease accessory protein
MPDTASLIAPLAAVAEPRCWQAELALGYEFAEGRTTLQRRHHYGPLRVQKPFYPEGDAVCHTLIVHPPGGIAGGDRLNIGLDAGPGSQVLVTTPGAAKWYKANRRVAAQTVKLSVASGAIVEWLPQESIVFDGAMVRLATIIELAAGAKYLGWDITVLGRRASGERFDNGSLRQQVSLRVAGAETFCEIAELNGNDRLLESPVGLAGQHVTGTLLCAGALCSDDLLVRCRTVAPADGARHSVTRLPGALAARYLGSSPQAARAYFTSVWRELRPWFTGRQACLPRIWST